jgi:hypothetical protein
MDEQRGIAVHHNGTPQMIVDSEEAPLNTPGEQPMHPAYGFHSFTPLGQEPVKGHRRLYRFKANGKNVVECCTRYLGLLEKLVQTYA